MKEKDIEINGKKYHVTEIKYIDTFNISAEESSSKAGMIKNMLTLSTNLTEEEVNNLTFKEGIELQKAINEVNDIGKESLNFQTPVIKTD